MKTSYYYLVLAFALIAAAACDSLHSSESLGEPVATVHGKLVGELPGHLDASRLRTAILWTPQSYDNPGYTNQDALVFYGCQERRSRSASWATACELLQKGYKNWISKNARAQEKINAPDSPKPIPPSLSGGNLQRYIDGDAELVFPSSVELDLYAVPFIDQGDGKRKATSTGMLVIYEDDGNAKLDITSLEDTQDSPDKVVAISSVPGVQTDDSEVLYAGLLYLDEKTNYPFPGLDSWIRNAVHSSMDEICPEPQPGFSVITIAASAEGGASELTCSIKPAGQAEIPLYYLEKNDHLPLCETPYWLEAHAPSEIPDTAQLTCLGSSALRVETSPGTSCGRTFDFYLEMPSCAEGVDPLWDFTSVPPSYWDCSGSDYEAQLDVVDDARLFVGKDYTCTLDSEDTLKCTGDNPLLQNLTPELASDVVQLSVNGWSSYACVLKKTGQTMCWGYYNRPSWGGWTSVAQSTSSYTRLSAAAMVPCGLTTDGDIECWYDPSEESIEEMGGAALFFEESYKQPGGVTVEVRRGEFTDFSIRSADAMIAIRASDRGLEWPVAPYDPDYHDDGCPPTGRFVQVTSHRRGFCGLREDGAVLCWDTVRSIYSAPSDAFKRISGGERHACGITLDGTIRCFGAFDDPSMQPPEGHYRDIAVATDRVCAVQDDGELICWGREVGETATKD